MFPDIWGIKTLADNRSLFWIRSLFWSTDEILGLFLNRVPPEIAEIVSPEHLWCPDWPVLLTNLQQLLFQLRSFKDNVFMPVRFTCVTSVHLFEHLTKLKRSFYP